MKMAAHKTGIFSVRRCLRLFCTRSTDLTSPGDFLSRLCREDKLFAAEALVLRWFRQSQDGGRPNEFEKYLASRASNSDPSNANSVHDFPNCVPPQALQDMAGLYKRRKAWRPIVTILKSLKTLEACEMNESDNRKRVTEAVDEVLCTAVSTLCSCRQFQPAMAFLTELQGRHQTPLSLSQKTRLNIALGSFIKHSTLWFPEGGSGLRSDQLLREMMSTCLGQVNDIDGAQHKISLMTDEEKRYLESVQRLVMKICTTLCKRGHVEWACIFVDDLLARQPWAVLHPALNTLIEGLTLGGEVNKALHYYEMLPKNDYLLSRGYHMVCDALRKTGEFDRLERVMLERKKE